MSNLYIVNNYLIFIIPKIFQINLKLKKLILLIKNYNHMMKQFYIIDSNNYIPCPNNETKNSFFKKTG